MRILLIDDHKLFREGLCLILSSLDSEIDVTEAKDCNEALTEKSQHFDLILLDYHLPSSEGIEALGTITSSFPHTSVVILSSEERPDNIRAMVQAGASGFIPKSSDSEIMFAALKLVVAGGVYLPEHVLDYGSKADSRLTGDSLPNAHNSPNANEKPSTLSGRQWEVLQRVIQGKVNKIIARELDISEGTVKAHLSSAYRALGVKNRTEAVFAVAHADRGST